MATAEKKTMAALVGDNVLNLHGSRNVLNLHGSCNIMVLLCNNVQKSLFSHVFTCFHLVFTCFHLVQANFDRGLSRGVLANRRRGTQVARPAIRNDNSGSQESWVHRRTICPSQCCGSGLVILLPRPI